ncbi:hypothetical protein M1V18_004406, partial [Salmonella enterica]|nr:hypothetical protein [Salmonella enterica]
MNSYLDKINMHDMHNNKIERRIVIAILLLIIIFLIFIVLRISNNRSPFDISVLTAFLIMLAVVALAKAWMVRIRVLSSNELLGMFDDCANDKEFREFFIPLFERSEFIGRKESKEITEFLI